MLPPRLCLSCRATTILSTMLTRPRHSFVPSILSHATSRCRLTCLTPFLLSIMMLKMQKTVPMFRRSAMVMDLMRNRWMSVPRRVWYAFYGYPFFNLVFWRQFLSECCGLWVIGVFWFVVYCQVLVFDLGFCVNSGNLCVISF